VNRILRRFRERGSLEPLAPGGNLSPLRGPVESKLKSLVSAMPDATVAEMAVALRKAEKLATSRSSVQRALVRLGYSRKTSPSSR
jgi:transposase